MNDKKSLVAIVAEASAIENMLIESGGELTPELEQLLKINSSELSLKADGYKIIMDRFGALETAYNAQAEFYDNIANQCANVVKSLKENIKFAISELGVNEVSGESVRFVTKETKGKLVIDNEDLIPLDFKETELITKIKKDDLKKALETSEIQGAHIEKSVQLNIYANTKKLKEAKAVTNE